jgi:hypothetical protein
MTDTILVPIDWVDWEKVSVTTDLEEDFIEKWANRLNWKELVN